LDPQQRIAELEAELAAAHARIAALETLVSEQAAQIVALSKQVEILLEKLGQNSSNSHRPPSSDGPGAGAKRNPQGKQGKPGKKRGGQPGHRGNYRALLPASQVQEFEDLFPSRCDNCHAELPEKQDPDALRYQVVELPEIKPQVREFRRHQVVCGCCGHKTRVAWDPTKIPSSPFGPRLVALIGLLTGVYHISRRKTEALLQDVLGVQLSLGTISSVEARVSDALQAPVAEAWERVYAADVKHTDGTSWLKAGALMCLWTVASTAATVFKVLADGGKLTLEGLFREKVGILVSDRAKTLTFWAMEYRQICWAHLLRKFVYFSELKGRGSTFGKELLDLTALIFDYRNDYRAGKLSKDTYIEWMRPVQAQVEAALSRAVSANIERLSGSCEDILKHRAALWTFVEHDDVEPTNNHAERELRAFVMWRRKSFGTQSDRGNLYAERIMTVAHTARKQRKNVFAFLTACMRAHADCEPAPSLFAAA